jgi:hypothetical protein
MLRKLPSYLHASENSVDRRHRPIPDRRVNLDELIKEEDDTMSTSSDVHSSSIESVAEETISVCLRLRPIKNVINVKPFKISNNTLIAKGAADVNSLNKDISEKHYTFTNIFDGEVSQRDLYDVCVQPQMDKFFGVNGKLMVTGCLILNLNPSICYVFQVQHFLRTVLQDQEKHSRCSAAMNNPELCHALYYKFSKTTISKFTQRP